MSLFGEWTCKACGRKFWASFMYYGPFKELGNMVTAACGCQRKKEQDEAKTS